MSWSPRRTVQTFNRRAGSGVVGSAIGSLVSSDDRDLGAVLGDGAVVVRTEQRVMMVKVITFNLPLDDDDTIGFFVPKPSTKDAKEILSALGAAS